MIYKIPLVSAISHRFASGRLNMGSPSPVCRAASVVIISRHGAMELLL
ncbi:hypothetical protein [Anseongella ginsenosidimutans]|nr:hypothetical protein [Anseongella ginsenosidimutans]